MFIGAVQKRNTVCLADIQMCATQQPDSAEEPLNIQLIRNGGFRPLADLES
jgi:hypothetical protein